MELQDRFLISVNFKNEFYQIHIWKDHQDVGKRKGRWDGNGRENVLERKSERER